MKFASSLALSTVMSTAISAVHSPSFLPVLQSVFLTLQSTQCLHDDLPRTLFMASLGQSVKSEVSQPAEVSSTFLWIEHNTYTG